MPEIQKNLKTITDDLTETVKTVSENINKSSDQVINSSRTDPTEKYG